VAPALRDRILSNIIIRNAVMLISAKNEINIVKDGVIDQIVYYFCLLPKDKKTAFRLLFCFSNYIPYTEQVGHVPFSPKGALHD